MQAAEARESVMNKFPKAWVSASILEKWTFLINYYYKDGTIPAAWQIFAQHIQTLHTKF